ncbi:MAG TPA: DedA family protein [Solirubrobacteraceae bacterium]|nr:DedA family protein [Solirubrobacteraceae bacterium]
MLQIAGIFSLSSGLGYALPAIIGLESMGVPSPGETALVAAAVLASQGHLKIWLVILIGASSAILGDNIGYLLGRRLGRDVLICRGPFHAHRARVVELGDRFFHRHGAKTVFIGRWVAWIRFATAWLAGINRMPFRVFFPWNALGGVTWAVTYGLLGYYGGQAVINVAERVGIAAAVLLAAAIVGAVLFVRLRERMRGGREPSGGGRSSSAGGRAGPPAEESR